MRVQLILLHLFFLVELNLRSSFRGQWAASLQKRGGTKMAYTTDGIYYYYGEQRLDYYRQRDSERAAKMLSLHTIFTWLGVNMVRKSLKVK